VKSITNNIYLDHAAATPVCGVASFAMERFCSSEFYNPSALYEAGVDAREAYEAARSEIARAIGARPANIVLTAGATEANQLAVASFGKVLVCENEHPSLLAHASDIIRVLDNGVVDLEHLRQQLPVSAEVFSVSLINSETGIMQPITEIAAICREAGVLLHVDASQATRTMKLNVARLGADIVTLNSGKVYGPKQVGALYVRSGVELKPLVVGGGQESGLRSGTENVAGVVGFAAALTAAMESAESERKRLTKLRNIFKQEFREAKLLFDNRHQNPGFIIIKSDLDAERLVYALDQRGVLVGTGAACSASKRGESSVLRLTLGRLNDEKNVRQAVKIIAEEIAREKSRKRWGEAGGQKVVVGLSGGVDSSVAAALLVEQGYDVKGVYMKNWSRDLPGMRCPWREDLADAKRVAVKLGIDFEVWDFEQEYFEQVVRVFVDGCKKGLTPNPDVLCNNRVKFKAFLERAEAEGAELIATGHYARNLDGKLAMPVDETKDQTYFLYRMSQESLSKVLFPLGGLRKSEVKKLAAERGFRTARKKESMGMCFVGDISMEEFLGEFIESTPGDIVDEVSGEMVGKHKGVAFYTLGQRHGLYIGGGAPYYVTGKDVEKNLLYVSRAAGVVEVDQLQLADCHWLVSDFDDSSVRARTRHLGELLPAELCGETVKLHEKSRPVASGQSVVLYSRDDVCLGGGLVK